MCKAWEDQGLDGMAEGTIDLLEDIGELSIELRKLIMEQTDLKVLRNWHKLAARAKSIEEFEKAAGLLERI